MRKRDHRGSLVGDCSLPPLLVNDAHYADNYAANYAANYVAHYADNYAANYVANYAVMLTILIYLLCSHYHCDCPYNTNASYPTYKYYLLYYLLILILL